MVQQNTAANTGNQSFLTEYVAGMATVKSLQMEPDIDRKYGDYLAQYLAAALQRPGGRP